MSAARLALSLTVAGVVALVAVALLAGDSWLDVLALAFLALPVAAWLCAGLLWLGHRKQPTAINLGERSIVAIRDALVATIGGVLGLNRLMGLGFLNDVALGLLVVGLLLVAAYPVAWLWQFFRGRWD